MFLKWSLRQLSIVEGDINVTIRYRCKYCNIEVTVHLSLVEWEDINNGLSFQHVFKGSRKVDLTHLKLGMCIKHGKRDLS